MKIYKIYLFGILKNREKYLLLDKDLYNYFYDIFNSDKLKDEKITSFKIKEVYKFKKSNLKNEEETLIYNILLAYENHITSKQYILCRNIELKLNIKFDWKSGKSAYYFIKNNLENYAKTFKRKTYKSYKNSYIEDPYLEDKYNFYNESDFF